MNCLNKLSHTVRQGDNFYQLAKHYRTTASMIASMNPGINPYNLQIGSILFICPGEDFKMPGKTDETNNMLYNCINPEKQIALTNKMRLAWLQHVYWTRLLIISIAERLKDKPETAARLLRNPGDIAAIYADFYPAEVSETIAALLTEHLEIGGKLITAMRDGKKAEAEKLNSQWYMNADKMANAFSSINPYYKHDEVWNMFYRHLDITTKEAALRLAGKYAQDIEAFNEAEAEMMEMADYFAAGLIRQFPQSFN